MASGQKKKEDLDTRLRSNREETIRKFTTHGYDLICISKHESICSECEPYQGETLSISGKNRKYQPLSQAISRGLFHKGCRHVISLSPVESDRFLETLEGKHGQEARDRTIDKLIREYERTKK